MKPIANAGLSLFIEELKRWKKEKEKEALIPTVELLIEELEEELK